MRRLELTLLTPEQELHLRMLVRDWRTLPPAVVIGGFVLVGVVEELFFRGYLFAALRAHGNARTAILGSARIWNEVEAANVPGVQGVYKTVWAGGGSLIRVQPETRTMTVGPDSAGAFPGPVCYRRGGTVPTVTDAQLVLGSD